jgi:hypothetical protein
VLSAPAIASGISSAASSAVTSAVGLGARMYGTYLATASGFGGAVLGKNPIYWQDARQMGMNAFNMAPNVWNFFSRYGQNWTANQAFLDEVRNTSQEIYLSNGTADLNGWFAREIEYLEDTGVDPSSFKMVGGRYGPFKF